MYNPKIYKYLSAALLTFGIVLGIISIFLTIWQIRFTTKGIKVEGVAKQVTWDDRDNMYYTTVMFKTEEGDEHEFKSKTSYSYRPYVNGEKLEVIYLASSPSSAIVNSFSEIWFMPILSGVLAVSIAGIGFGFKISEIYRRKLKEKLLAYGRKIETDYSGVERNTQIIINGESPFRIVSQWMDDSTNKVYEFYSDNIWYDPTNYAKDRKITVFVETDNFRKYFMDTTFLPELVS